MKTLIYNSLVTLLFGLSCQPAYAELLIVKKMNGIYSPLDPTTLNDNEIEKINGIFLKYQWPMCITSDLTKEEQDELFAQKEGVEERFIEKKIRTALNSDDYFVVFFPNVLYEAHCLTLIFNAAVSADIEQQKKLANWINASLLNGLKINLVPALNPTTNDKSQPQSDKKSLQLKALSPYTEINSTIFDKVNMIFLQANFEIGKKLLSQLKPDTDLSKNIESDDIISHFTTLLIEEINKVLVETDSFEKIKRYMLNKVACMGTPLDKLKIAFSSPFIKNILLKIISLEYKARKTNSGLLIRGTKSENFQTMFDKSPTLKETNLLLGNTLCLADKSKSIEMHYKEKIFLPYSISLANSLFAGCLADMEACALFYLLKEQMGYALIIDKGSYFLNQCDQLLFISPLNTIAALAQCGEFFHSRTKAAVDTKVDSKNALKSWTIRGIFLRNYSISDPNEILLITRDPLYHAELFSNFLTRNGILIQTGDEGTLTKEEKEFVHEVMVSQSKATQFYKNTRIFKKYLDKRMKQLRNNKRRLSENGH